MASTSHVLPRQKAGKMLSIMSAETEAFKTTNDRSQAHVGAHDCPLRVIDVKNVGAKNSDSQRANRNETAR